MAKSAKAGNALPVLEHELSGSKLKLTARCNGALMHIDTIDPSNASHRRRFVRAVVIKAPEADATVLDAELLKLADAIRAPTIAAPSGDSVELDIARIVRPELFITQELCGLTVPVVIDREGEPAAKWTLVLRWADGRRECRELSSCIALPDNTKLWIHPFPGEPSMTTAAGWSAASRRAWLGDSAAPNAADLFKQLCERINYFIDLPPDVAAGTTATLALWSMLTHVFQAWDSVPYLFVGGPMSSGKTRVFEILSRLVRRPLQSSNLTAPALFRSLNDHGGTLLFDEAERLRQSTPDVQEILSMLLAGYKRGGQATRLEAVGDVYRTVAFDVYGPKALACIAGLPPALASRCIPIPMFRAGPDSVKPQRRIDADPACWQRLRDDLHALALEHGTTWLDLAQREHVCPKGMNGRAYEIWQPLLALAWWIETQGANGLLSLMQRFALASVEGAKDDQIPDADETLLEVLGEKLRLGASPTPGEILEQAKVIDAATFDRWTARTISNRLKPYGIIARKIDRRREYRDTTLADLARIQRHYGIDLGIVETSSATSETASLASRIVPENADWTRETPVPGRNGTKRDAR
jgi:hypothetical protein